MTVFICTVCDSRCICSADRIWPESEPPNIPPECLFGRENGDPSIAPPRWKEVDPQIAELLLRGLVEVESARGRR